MRRRITVLVGTDHHDFSRVVRWADVWQHDHPGDDVLVQHGFSPAPCQARGVELVPPTQLVDLVAGADVVVTHGGPGTIMSARHAGHRPLAVPRDPSLGEHVDEHQMRFVTWAAAKGLCQEVLSPEELSKVIAALGPPGTRSGEAAGGAGLAVETLRLEEAIATPRRRRDPSPSAVPVLYWPGPGWAPERLPVGMDGRPIAVLGNVAGLWLGGPGTRCSCGLGVRQCAFWTEVARRALGGWSAEILDATRARHLEVRAHAVRAARRHPGTELRRSLLAVALTYRAVVSAGLAATGARTAVDHGGPLADALVLSHCRELDLSVLRAGRQTTASATWAALRYRAVPLIRAKPAAGLGGPRDGSSSHEVIWGV